MFAFWIVVLILAAVVLFGVAFLIPKVVDEGKRSEVHPRRITRIVTLSFVALITVIMFFTSMVVTVSTKNVGIETAFGRVDWAPIERAAPHRAVEERDGDGCGDSDRLPSPVVTAST